MFLKNKIIINFLHNYSLNSCLDKKLGLKNLKTMIFFFLILKTFLKTNFFLKYKKKKFNKFTILKAPYKNKMAQRQYFISRFYFSLEFNINNFCFSSTQAVNLLKKFIKIGSLFFYSIHAKLLFLAN